MDVLNDINKSEEILRGQTKILKMIIEDEETETILEEIIFLLESQAPNMKSSIVFLDETGNYLAKSIGPSLPEDYLSAIPGVPIGPLAGSCGTAAYLRELVIVEDIHIDPRWESFREIIKHFNIRACWSMPIMSKQGKVLGTFAMYYDHVRKPIDEEIELLKFVVSLAGLTIEKRQFQDAQRNYETKIIAQNSELTKINQELDSFVYRASHDIKAPIASMLGIVNLINRIPLPDSDLAVLLAHMRKSVGSLESYVKELIDFSRNLRLESLVTLIDLNKLISQIFETLGEIEEPANLKWNISLDSEGEFYSDKERLFIILKNILSNSIRYRSSERAPQITINANVSSAQASITVKDNGIGIEQEKIHKIFQMFYRGSELATGSGLGLYIVKETLQKLKGKIEVSSEVGVGTAFMIILPNQKISAT
ncbi:MAG: GAF domain-containing sensor histidine kinase [Bacteroidetes bacterium]|nr:GAF domain-containing sensor histidine kinase [Bacteroidota bacterium]MBI3482085.1 GAF domain-containing sensor histidine kinase [Bacteroidota bacterium]